jgi:hypothetical protein
MKYITEVVLIPPPQGIGSGMFVPQEPHVEVSEIDSYEELEELLYMIGDIVKVIVDDPEIEPDILNRPEGKLFKCYHGDENISYRIFNLKPLTYSN